MRGRCISVPHWLILDAGNSRLKFGLWDGHRVHATGAVSWSGDWPGELDMALAAMARPERVVVGSVHQTATVEALEAISRRRWGCPLTRITTTAAACGVQNGYRDYRQLGVDRWAAVVAAHLRAPEAWHLVIDVGTAATVDVVGPRGDYRGGAIFPGLRLLADALGSGTAGLPSLAGEAVPLPARSTPDAIRGGVVHGLAGALRHLASEMLPAEAVRPRRWLTGGDAGRLQPLLPQGAVWAPDLVLEGLAQLARESG
ncbi:putative transcriptional acitvator, Baf family [Alkalilimnicola ehrlichii MLHE-1]|nr:putative transcriptional acitvator, Baf family [Alkalilimnicola ehrlichii MLHE-1]